MIAIGADHAGFEYKEKLKDLLRSLGYEFKDFGTNSTESTDYPDYAHDVALAVGAGSADLGILICGTGIGMSAGEVALSAGFSPPSLRQALKSTASSPARL